MKILLRPRLRTFFLLMALLSASLYAQPQLESLNRGLVAVRKSDAVVFLSWRYLGTDPDGVSFNLYRDGEKLNEYPLKGATNYEDATSANHSYEVRAVVDGVEQAGDGAVQVWASNYLDLPLSVPAGGQTPDGVNYTYSPNDLSVGDLDGDGTYEIIVKWDPSNSKDNSQSGYTGNVYLDAYKLDGTFLWRIDLGKNIRAGAHYTQFLVYDFDGDGQAEVVCKTAPGTIDGDGVFLSEGPAAAANHSADYRNSSGYILQEKSIYRCLTDLPALRWQPCPTFPHGVRSVIGATVTAIGWIGFWQAWLIWMGNVQVLLWRVVITPVLFWLPGIGRMECLCRVGFLTVRIVATGLMRDKAIISLAWPMWMPMVLMKLFMAPV